MTTPIYRIVKQILSFVVAFTFFPLLAISQNDSKFNFSLQRKLKDPMTNNKEIAIFVQGDVKEIKVKTEEAGGFFKYSTGNIAAINIRLDKINELAALKSVARIENNDLLNSVSLALPHYDEPAVTAMDRGTRPAEPPSYAPDRTTAEPLTKT